MPFPTDANYNVLHTDYENVSVVYACDAKTQTQTAWIMSKKPIMDADTFKSAKQVLASKIPHWNFEAHIDNKGTQQGDICDYAQKLNWNLDLSRYFLRFVSTKSSY